LVRVRVSRSKEKENIDRMLPTACRISNTLIDLILKLPFPLETHSSGIPNTKSQNPTSAQKA